jgi:adenylate cyclase
MAVRFEDIGEQHVKNIVRPIRVYRVVVDAAGPAKRIRGVVPRPLRARAAWGIGIVAAIAAAAAWWYYRLPVDSGAPAMSVGVMPLTATSTSVEAAQRSESITRDLAAQLALSDGGVRIVPLPANRSGDIAERARTHRVRYVLEGDIETRSASSEIRLRMVEGTSGALIWNETVSLADPATAKEQARALRTATEHLDGRLRDVEVQRVAGLGERATAPTELVLRARALYISEKTLESFRKQQELCEQALRVDPNHLWAMLCIATALDNQNDLDSALDHRTRLIQRMDEVTAAAVRLHPGAPEAWEWRSGALMNMGRWDAALEASAMAIQLDPYAAYHVMELAWSMTMVGRPADAVALVAQAIAMDPPGHWWALRAGCEAHLLLGQYKEAIEACEKAAGRGGNEFDLAYFLTAAYAHLGNQARAKEEGAKILRKAPGFTIEALRAKKYSTNPEYMRLAEEHWYSGLRKAGIPEK